MSSNLLDPAPSLVEVSRRPVVARARSRIRTNETGAKAERMEGGLSDISVLSSREWLEDDDT